MFKILICIVAFIFFFSSSALPETIQLKSGRTIEGEIVERGADYIRLDFQGITLTYYLDEIETIDGRPPAEERGSLSTSPASPHAPQFDRVELKNRLKAQLKELHYPEHTHPALKEELLAFFERINFLALQSKAQLAKDNPDKLKELAKEIGAIFESEGFLDIQPQPLIRLLVDSFAEDDILSVIEQSPLSPEEKEAVKRNIYACSAISQLGGMTLNSMGLAAKTLNSTSVLPGFSHATNYISLNYREILLIDFLNQHFKIIDLDYWYNREGKYLALKPQHRLVSDKALKVIQRFQQGIVLTQIKEILNLYFLTFNITDHYSTSASIYSNRGEVYRRKGNLNQAIPDFNQALRINPNYASAYNNRGNAYVEQGNLNQAISDYNQALRINPNFAEAYYNRGFAYHHQGDLTQAISDYNQALRINPNLADAYINCGIAYFYQGDYTRAWENVHRAQELGYQVHPEFLQELRRASERER